MENIEKHHETFEEELLGTIQDFNSTVEKVQENVEHQVQEVNDNVSSQNSFMIYQFAGTFAILGSLISIWHISSHVRKMNEPIIQRKIMGIMWMIPIYSVSSWLGLVFVEAQGYLSFLKDVYEAYVIYTFLSLLIAILGRGDRNVVINQLTKQAESDHLNPPLHVPILSSRPTFPTPRHKAEAVLDQCQFFCMQFVFLRPITSIVTVIADEFYENRWEPTMPQLYMTLITNVSIFFAFSGLMKFYHVMKDELIWCNPFSKFLCIKGIVFMTFWQQVAISFIAHAIYEDNEDDNADEKATEWGKRAQSGLICIEMFFFAIAHCFVFPTDEWEAGYREKMTRRIKANFGDSLALRDFVKDVKTVMYSRKRNKHHRTKGQHQSNGIQQQGLGQGSDIGDSAKTSLIADTSYDDQFVIDGDDDDGESVQGWSRIEKYIHIIDEEGEASRNAADEDGNDDLHLNVHVGGNGRDSGPSASLTPAQIV